MSKDNQNYFTEEIARRYDERNARLAPLAEGLHFLLRLVLKRLPERSRILCVGAGTGADILALAPAFPQWSFVALDPSAPMLEFCRKRLTEAGFADRCEFVHGYVEDAPATLAFDAVVSLFVAHFVTRNERPTFLRHMVERLRTGGTLVSSEISFDLDSKAFPSMLENWREIQAQMGATEESLAGLPNQLRNILTVLPPSETERLWREAGVEVPIRFFQSLMIGGWYGTKA